MSIMTEAAKGDVSGTRVAGRRMVAAASALWAVAALGAVWFVVVAVNWERSHPDVEDHGVAFFVGALFAGLSGVCALAWLRPALLLRRGRAHAFANGVVTAVLTSPLAAVVMLVLLLFDNWARWLTLAVLLSQGLGIAGVMRTYGQRRRRRKAE
jgi:hypothetical protein